ncbi:MAG: MFS transporter [Halanaerobium sp.]|nr:MFS transporter [Halanaerobium sp.]
MQLIKNIRRYYYYSTFAELLILGPIIVLYFLAKGLSFTEVMLLQSIASICVVLFEVPTGAVADRLGRKHSLILGALLWAVSLAIYIIGNSFFVFALAEMLFSLGATLKSGADTALIYDSLQMVEREGEFQEIEGQARSLSLYAQAVGSIIAGFVYEVNIYLPLIISIGFMIVTILITLTFAEPAAQETHLARGRKYFDQIKESGRYIFKHEKIKAVIIFSMVFFVFYRMGFWLFQPYMESVQIPVRYFGVIFFIFNLVAALTSKRVHIIMSLTKPRTLTFMAFLLIVSFVLMGFITVQLGFLAILLQQVARGLYRPVTRKYLNKHIPSDMRATILSFQSLAANIAVAASYPFMGLLKDHSNIFVTHRILAALMLVMTIFTIRYMNKRLGQDHQVSGPMKWF